MVVVVVMIMVVTMTMTTTMKNSRKSSLSLWKLDGSTFSGHLFSFTGEPCHESYYGTCNIHKPYIICTNIMVEKRLTVTGTDLIKS